MTYSNVQVSLPYKTTVQTKTLKMTKGFVHTQNILSIDRQRTIAEEGAETE